MAEDALKGFLIKIMERKYSAKDNQPVRVQDRLYIGSIGSAYNRDGLIKAGITHVICAARHIQMKYPSDFTYLKLDISDTSACRIQDHFQTTFDFIER